ncbi:MAG TPA: sialidase family protein, partial [Chitinophagaceae bacterium]|nr:sialidase family protein [Chitinophagaceae bacterium]
MGKLKHRILFNYGGIIIKMIFSTMLVTSLFLPGNISAQQAPFTDTTLLFEPTAGGYTMFHVPALVITTKGTVLAFTEGRYGKGKDWDDMDLLLRRSLDGGNTWEPSKVVIPYTKGKPTSN